MHHLSGWNILESGDTVWINQKYPAQIVEHLESLIRWWDFPVPETYFGPCRVSLWGCEKLDLQISHNSIAWRVCSEIHPVGDRTQSVLRRMRRR